MSILIFSVELSAKWTGATTRKYCRIFPYCSLTRLNWSKTCNRLGDTATGIGVGTNGGPVNQKQLSDNLRQGIWKIKGLVWTQLHIHWKKMKNNMWSL